MVVCLLLHVGCVACCIGFVVLCIGSVTLLFGCYRVVGLVCGVVFARFVGLLLSALC